MDGRCNRHQFEPSENLCRECGGEFCTECLVYSFGPGKPPYCIPCALASSGIRSTARNAPKRPRKEIRREHKARMKELAGQAPPAAAMEWPAKQLEPEPFVEPETEAQPIEEPDIVPAAMPPSAATPPLPDIPPPATAPAAAAPAPSTPLMPPPPAPAAPAAEPEPPAWPTAAHPAAAAPAAPSAAPAWPNPAPTPGPMPPPVQAPPPAPIHPPVQAPPPAPSTGTADLARFGLEDDDATPQSSGDLPRISELTDEPAKDNLRPD